MELLQKVKNLPAVPGVYKFKNSLGEIIYVGKAKSLKHRVKSYFAFNLNRDTKTFQLVENIADLEFIEVMSEFEALVLEAALIKKYNPKYNILLKDDKSLLYIVISTSSHEIEGKTVKIPKMLLTRERDLNKQDFYAGPFINAEAAKTVYKAIRRLIPFRDCSESKYERYKNLTRPCLYGFIGLCPAPCVNFDLTAYKASIGKIKKILNGETNSVIGDITKQMDRLARENKFEEAANQRDLLRKFEQTRIRFKIAQVYVDNPYLVEDLMLSSLVSLKKSIPLLKDLPRIIECYDISNLSGKEAVGSLVSAVNGRLDKSRYKKFKIKLKESPDDFFMLSEVLARRIKRGLEGKSVPWELPDLLVIDGGKGQVSSVLAVLDDLKVTIPVIGLAKKQETIVYVAEGEFHELVLARTDEGLKLLQRLRDEAHRFAQAYHHKLRLQKIEEESK